MSQREAQARIASVVAARAEILDLRGLGLKALPPLPPELQGLRAIELGSNRLAAFPEGLLSCRRLRRLGLGSNRIAALPTEIAQLEELESLDLSENRLERLPESIGSLAQLVEVSFFDNRLTEIPGSILSIKHLERLDLSTNRLSALPSLVACRRSRLRALDASRNRLTRIPECLERLRALRNLNLANNRLASLQGLEGLLLLDELDVANNTLASVVATLRQLPRLQRVDVTGNQIREAEREEIAHYDASRSQASAVIDPLIRGGESGGFDVHYFDQVPFSFDADLAVGSAGVPGLIDLYYKKFGGQDVSLELADHTLMKLEHASRTRALDFARGVGTGAQPVRVLVGQAHGQNQLDVKRAFVVDTLVRISGSQLVAPDGTVAGLAGTDTPTHEVALQWSGSRTHSEQASRSVGVGFADIEAPEMPLSELEPLPCDTWVWLWCTVGDEHGVTGAIGGGQTLAPGLAERVELDVVVFSNPRGFSVETRSGTLGLAGATCFVLRPADVPLGGSADLVATRLFFKVKTPARPTTEQLRVNLYHRGLLVQALNVSASTGRPSGDREQPPITVTTDYVLSCGLEEQHLLALGEHRLSVFAGESSGEMAGFRFYGADGEIEGSAQVEATKIGTILDRARQAFRRASWGSDEAYDPTRDSYRYEPTAPQPDFKEDLVRLAQCGFELWDELVQSFAQDGDVHRLQQQMQRPGIVELALKSSSTQLLPLAILYDRPIESRLRNLDAFRLCPECWEGPDCLDGRCPNLGDSHTVCPSGFWGYRHSIGVPVGSTSADVAASIAPSEMRLFASAYAGTFPLRDSHLEALERLVGAGSFEKILTYQKTVERMRQGGFQLLYLYCHGGIDGRGPYLLIGRDDEDPNQIARATLRSSAIEWTAPRALVFINGCHTTALEPEQAMDLVNGFVDTAHASGVIGTEVTVFEPLATKMAEHFVRRLLAGADVGTALRDARRALLLGDRPNPLGLVYIPYALATLKLEGLPGPAPFETQ